MKYLFFCSFCLLYLNCFADNPITGNQNVDPGSTETYTVNWDSWGTVYENFANVTWTITGGILLSSDKHSATIQWNNIPSWENGYGSIEVFEDLGGGFASLNVNLINFVEGIAETCNGSLGPPVIFFDFGSGTNPGPSLPSGVTTYSYNSSCAIFSGEYSITNSTVGCRGPWLGISDDHTVGDINGYMMIVDADDRRGEVFRLTTNGLTNAFRYEFSAWIANISEGWPNPRVHFEIRNLNNTLIKKSPSYVIIFNSTTPWQRISFMFDIPVGTTSIQVVLVNEHSNPDGNDFVVDDIAFAPCYTPILASFTANPIMTEKSYICNNGGTVNLYSWWPTNLIPFNNPSFQWQKSTDYGSTWSNIIGATNLNYTQSENTEGIYKYRILAYETSNINQFVVSNVITYFIQKMIVDPGTFYVQGCTSTQTQLTPSYYLQYSDPSGPPLSFNFTWTPGTNLSNTQVSDPVISLPALPPPNPPNPPNPLPPINYTYSLTVQSIDFGCAATATQIVSHINPRKVGVFTAFTPNNDGLNDFFFPKYIWDYSYFGAEFWIYNRWGQLIHYRNQGTTQQDWHWDGKVGGVPQNGDNYVFWFRIPGCPTNYLTPLPPGVTYENGIVKGNFVLVR